MSQVTSTHGVHPNLAAQWRDQVLAGLPSLLSNKAAQEQATREATHAKQLEELYAEIGRLTTQLAWLKKSCAARCPGVNG